MATPIDVLCPNLVKFGRREIGEFVRYLPTQKKFWLAPKLSLLSGSRPKSARASPQQCAHSAPDFIQFTFGGAIAERVNTVEYFHYSSEEYLQANKNGVMLYCNHTAWNAVHL